MTILASTPSSTASTSIVALSVSISARTSPACTASPSLLTQRAILPSVIVGDSAGISTWLGIQLLLIGLVLVDQPAAQMIDRIVFGTHPVDFILAAVFGRVRHRVAAVAVG